VLVVVAAAAGVIVVLFPVRLFGVTRRALEYSVEGRITGHYGFTSCVRRGANWSCEVFDGGTSTSREYAVTVSKKGCWTARASAGKPVRSCLKFRDYVRILDR
jgi:hypothetical protein